MDLVNRYEKIRRYLEFFIPSSRQKFPGERGFKRMEKLLELLGNPHQKYPTVHIAGTSGKGSTATILSHILTTAGYKTGLTISPHLQVINERMQVNGKYISLTKLEFLLDEVKPVIEIIKKSIFGQPSYFEILLGLAFLHFAKERVGIAVVEAGLGGRFDGTNVIKPLVGVITNIGFDHTDILGKTIEEIAQDKAGIIKPGIVVVSGAKQEEAKKILTDRCQMMKAKLVFLNRDFHYTINNLSKYGTKFDIKIQDKTYEKLFLSLAGKHQVENAAVAVRAALILSQYGFPLGERVIRRALRTVFFPGRLEVIQKYPLLILDGAHNPDKLQALIAAMPLFPIKERRWLAVCAFKRDKPVRQMLKLLIPNVKQLIATQFTTSTDQGKHLAMKAEKIYQIAVSITSRRLKARGKTFPIPNLKKAIKAALESAGSTGQVIVTGSLYLVGEIRELWHPKEELLR